MIIQKTTHAGFTLIETMVAVSVLMVALTAPLTLASQSLFASVYAKDKIVASYLAQEAVEVVREKRDNNLLKIVRGDSTEWLEGVPLGQYFSVDVATDEIILCGDACKNTAIQHDGAFYTYVSGDATRFSREIMVTTFPGSDEATVTASVYWKTGAFKKRSVIVEEQIFNWVPSSNTP